MAVLDFLNFADNETIEFGFESILSKNITHWDFDNQHSAKKIKQSGVVKISSVEKSNEYTCNWFELNLKKSKIDFFKNRNKLWTSPLKICLANLS